MNVNGHGEMTSSGKRPEGGLLGRLRVAALITVVAGAAGSLGLMFRAGQHTPRFLLALFAIWVPAPFIALALAYGFSKHWSAFTRAALYIVMLIIALSSLAIYADDARGHRRPQAAFVYVAVPLASWLLIAMAVPLAKLISSLLSRRSEGAE